MVRMAPSSTPALAGESITAVPDPLPVMGVGVAFLWSRRLRRRTGNRMQLK